MTLDKITSRPPRAAEKKNRDEDTAGNVRCKLFFPSNGKN